MTDLTHYEILGLAPNASRAEIRKAFKSLAQKYHPDRNPDNEEHFRRIKKAYDVLYDPQAKALYDRGVRQGINPEEFRMVLKGVVPAVVKESLGYAHQPGYSFRRAVFNTLKEKQLRAETDRLEIEKRKKLLDKILVRVDKGKDTLVIESLEKLLVELNSALTSVRISEAVFEYLAEDTERLHEKEDEDEIVRQILGPQKFASIFDVRDIT